MKKIVILSIIVLVILLTALITLNSIKANTLELSIKKDALFDSIDVESRIVLTSTEMNFKSEFFLKPKVDQYVFDDLKNGDYLLEVFFEEKLYKKFLIKIENNELFLLNKLHTFSIDINSLFNIESVYFTSEDKSPIINWNVNSAIEADYYKLKFGTKEVIIENGTGSYNLSELLNNIFTHEIKEGVLEAYHSNVLLSAYSIDLRDYLYHFDFYYSVRDNNIIECHKKSSFDSNLLSYKVISGDRVIKWYQSTPFSLSIEDVHDRITGNTIKLKIITEYDNLPVCETIMEIDCYPVKFNLRGDYPLDNLFVSASLPDSQEGLFFRFQAENELTIFSFIKLDRIDLRLALDDRDVYHSLVELEETDHKIHLDKLLGIDIEAMQFTETSLIINLKASGIQSGIKPDYLEIKHNDGRKKIDYATQIILEKPLEDDLDIQLTPIYFETHRGESLALSMSSYQLKFNIPKYYDRDVLKIFVEDTPILLDEDIYRYFNVDSKEKILVEIEYNGEPFQTFEVELGVLKTLELDLFSIAGVLIDEIRYQEKFVEIQLSCEENSEKILPEYFVVDYDNQSKVFSDYTISLENSVSSKTVRITPYYKNELKGETVIFEKPEKLSLSINFASLTFDKDIAVHYEITPINVDSAIKLFKRTGESFEEMKVEFKASQIILPLEFGDNDFQIYAYDDNGQTLLKDFSVTRSKPPEVSLLEVNSFGIGGFLTWTMNDFYDYYTVTIKKESNTLDYLTVDSNFIEFDELPSNFVVSVTGHYKGLSQLCFSQEVDLSKLIKESSVYSYDISHTNEKQISAKVKFNNFEYLKTLTVDIYNSLGKKVNSVEFLKEEFDGNSLLLKWESIPGESYKMIFYFVYLYSIDDVEYRIYIEQKSFEILAPRPEKITWSSYYQIAKDIFLLHSNDFGKNVIYRYTFSNTTDTYQFDSTVPVNEIKLKDALKDYTGELNLNLKIFDCATNEVLNESNVFMEKIDADIYLANSIINSTRYEGKDIFISNIVDISNYKKIDFDNCTIHFNSNAYFKMNTSDLNISHSTLTSVYDRSKVNEEKCFVMTSGSINISDSFVEGMDQVIKTSKTKIKITDTQIRNCNSFINSQKGQIIIDHITFDEGENFSDNIFENSIEIRNSSFKNAKSVFSIGVTEMVSFEGNHFEGIESDTLNIYDSKKTVFSDLEFVDVGMAIKVTNTDFTLRDTKISDSANGLYLMDLDTIINNLLIENVKNGIYLINCFSQINNSKLSTAEIALYYINEQFKLPQNTFLFSDNIDISELNEKNIVSVVYNSIIISETAIVINKGPNNVILRGLPPNGSLVHDVLYYDNLGVARKSGKVFFAKNDMTTGEHWSITDQSENSDYLIPFFYIVDSDSYSTESTENIHEDSPINLLKKYESTNTEEKE